VIRPYFYARSALFVAWLLIEPFVTASIFEVRKVAEHQRR
jgi:hypothetical protein